MYMSALHDYLVLA